MSVIMPETKVVICYIFDYEEDFKSAGMHGGRVVVEVVGCT